MKVAAPILVLLSCAGVFALLLIFKAEPKTVSTEESYPEVRVIVANAGESRLSIQADGELRARTNTLISAEVAGKVISVSENFAAGGYFAPNDALIEIDPTDYEAMVASAKVNAIQAETAYRIEVQETALHRSEWAEIVGGEANELQSRALQLSLAEAKMNAAKLSLAKAEQDLANTKISAPGYTGRIDRTNVNVGDLVSPGVPVASAHSTDFGEVRLYVLPALLARLDAPLGRMSLADENAPGNPKATVTGEIADETITRDGEIVRIESVLDPGTRMAVMVCRIPQPFAAEAGALPMVPNMYVRVEIEGRLVKDVFVLPRSALREGGKVFVIEKKEFEAEVIPGEGAESSTTEKKTVIRDVLRIVHVDVLETSAQHAIVSSGIESGDRVCVSALDIVTDGMIVAVAE
ncbi:MAG: efflux RND transporter periplasmic adaptor subunit [Planctomycetes bacterium]|nr:efflux RND transporter periplasmic adaptor subunit [Planctomycetota bacterium]